MDSDNSGLILYGLFFLFAVFIMPWMDDSWLLILLIVFLLKLGYEMGKSE